VEGDKAVALYDYEASPELTGDDRELSFKKGDLISIVKRVDQPHIKGACLCLCLCRCPVMP
jgi:hypothetical protein